MILAIQSLIESSSVKFSWIAATPSCALSIFFASSKFELYEKTTFAPASWKLFTHAEPTPPVPPITNTHPSLKFLSVIFFQII